MMNRIEIKKISETEYLVGENSYKITEENIVYITINGDQNKELALKHESLGYELAEKLGGRANYFINLNNAGKNSPEARIILNKASNDVWVNKVALWGLNPVAKVIASFVIGFKKHNKMRFFNSKDKALAWLRE